MGKKEKKPETEYRLIREFDEKGRPIKDLMMNLIKQLRSIIGFQTPGVIDFSYYTHL
ncbi:MAG: hypothetical protein QME46_00305 [Thermoanaerobacteraceae bacterium]|nr:hypothetical protein [Thermoanaerobacteraceae bacterium]